MAEGDQSPRARIVLLGASNLTRGISTAVESARLTLGGPLECMVAMGHGRSFGMSSSVLARTIDGILHCGLWDALRESRERRPELPTYALITDIGNDIVYGSAPATVVEWVEECIERLESICGASERESLRRAMTMIPLENILSVRLWQYRIVKGILFPSRDLPCDEAMNRARELDQRLRALAVQREIPFIAPQRTWYGFDPIHVRMKHWPEAWMRMLSSLGDDAEAISSARARGSLRRWAQLRRAMPQHYRMFGIARQRQQPAVTLGDGTTVALY